MVVMDRAVALAENELASICSGIAAGHLRQVRENRMVFERHRDSNRGNYLPATPPPVVRLEHLHTACAWLQRAAFYRALELL